MLVKASDPLRRSATDRVEAFIAASARLGLRTTVLPECFDGGLDDGDLRLLTEGDGRATSVLGWSDAVAGRICRSLEAHGVAIPGAVAVAGFDGLPGADSPRFDLTTVRAPWAAVGREAVRLLDALTRA